MTENAKLNISSESRHNSILEATFGSYKSCKGFSVG